MKAFKVIFFVFFLSLFVSSCVNDEPLAKVKYEISGLDNLVAEIKYTGALGGTETVTDISKFAGGKDFKTIGVNFLPFESKLKISVNNFSPNSKNYTLTIYVDGVAKTSTIINAAASSLTTGELNYTVD